MNSGISLSKVTQQVATTPDELKTTILDLNRENNERARAITLAALLDAALESALVTKLRPDISEPDRKRIFEYPGILATFSAKIDMAFMLNLTGPKVREDLNRIRRIRNAFSHAKGIISFDTPQVATECDGLNFPTRHSDLGSSPLKDASAADKFWFTATLLIQLFYSHKLLSEDRLLSEHWLSQLQH